MLCFSHPGVKGSLNRCFHMHLLHSVTSSHARKKMRFEADVELSNESDKASSVKRKDKGQREKLRRSPRHTTDSSDLEDFDVPKYSPKKRKMTISTETISETDRIDKKKSR